MKRILMIILIIAVTVLTAIPVSSDTLSQLQQYQQQNYNIKNEIDKTLQNKKSMEREKSYLKQLQDELAKEETRQRKKEANLYQELQSIEEASKSFDAQLEALWQEYDNSIEELKHRLKNMYEYSMVSSLDLLFQSKNLMDFLERIDLMRSMTKANNALIERLRVLERDIQFKSSMKEQELMLTSNMIAEQSQRIESIRSSRSDLEDDIRGKSLEIQRLEEQLDKLNRKSQELTNYIKELQSKQKYVGGEMAWPLPSCYSVGSAFGSRWHPILGGYRMHNGIDIGGTHGASIVAANDGTVIYAGWQDGYGYTVIIDHGVDAKSGKSISTLYAHCSSIVVKNHQGVKKGQIIAKVGSTGLSTGPHLHFEVRENGIPVNPLNNKYLKVN